MTTTSPGRFRARVLGPDGRYVSAPATFATRTDAAVWVDVQRADLVRGMWKRPAPPPWLGDGGGVPGGLDRPAP